VFGLKKQLIKNLIKFNVIENSPGLLKIQIERLSEIDNQFKIYEEYAAEAVKLLNGVEKIDIDYDKNTVTISYDRNRVTAQKIYSWLQVMLDVTLDNLEFIQKYGETHTEDVKQRIYEVLKLKVKPFNAS
jgi:copper chaperone CopZ